MKIEQSRWSVCDGWVPGPSSRTLSDAQLVMAFGASEILPDRVGELRAFYPSARLLGCSTAGEILGTNVCDGSVVVTAVRFDSSSVRSASTFVENFDQSFNAGRSLAEKLSDRDLVHVFVLSDGLAVNGSDLAKGLYDGLPSGVGVTGGLAADGSCFMRTAVFLDSPPVSGMVAAIGFYGSRLKVGYGSVGGWDPFGVEWKITRSRGGVLYELDEQSALDLYKLFLGEHASGLPATGLFFPLSLRVSNSSRPIVRTVLAVNEAEGSLTFSGDIPQGAYARFMKANFDRLIEGAGLAAKDSSSVLGRDDPDLAILISCVGRKLVLKQRIEEEVEAVRDALGDRTALTGYYSYGELSPFVRFAPCELHNQTMTITCFSED